MTLPRVSGLRTALPAILIVSLLVCLSAPAFAQKQSARTVRVTILQLNDVYQTHAGHAPIFKWGSDARILGRIDLNLYAATGRIESIDWAGIPVDDSVADDPAVAAVVAEYEKKLSAELDKPLGRAAIELDARSITNRTGETNLGNLVADSFRRATGADVGLLNGGSVRANMTFAPGQITRRDVISILPFENPVVKVEVSGSILRTALENGVSQIVEEKESGRFPQVSGLQFEFDGRKPVGSRVVKIVVNGQPLDEKKIYTLATNTYLIHGGDNYKMFKEVKLLIPEESAEIDSTMLASFIAAAGEVAPKVEGRIKRLDQ